MFLSDLHSGISTTVIDDVESFNESPDLNVNNPTFYELNVPIPLQEVTSVVKNLKRNKSESPSDHLVNKQWIFLFLFNKAFNSWHFPESWSKGFIVPIHKMGDTNLTSNYLGITLLSNFGKQFLQVY